jgi:GMP synthase-like glutamine amidotransferase
MPPPQKILVLEHSGSVGPGYLEDFARSRGLELDRVKLHNGGPMPDLRPYGAMVVLGGEMNVYEEEAYPFLKPENLLIRRAVENGLPYLGICLGGQLLAKAMGGRITRNPQPEFGPCRISLTESGRLDPLFAGLSDSMEFCQWHGDTFSRLPDGAVLLAGGEVCKHQAFRMGQAVYGLQFHPEATVEIVKQWAIDFASQLETSKHGEIVCGKFAVGASAIYRQSERLFENFFRITGFLRLS